MRSFVGLGPQPDAQDAVVALPEAGEELIEGDSTPSASSAYATTANGTLRSRRACRRDPRGPARLISDRSTPTVRACGCDGLLDEPGVGRRRVGARACARATRGARRYSRTSACSIAANASAPQVNGPWFATSTAGTSARRQAQLSERLDDHQPVLRLVLLRDFVGTHRPRDRDVAPGSSPRGSCPCTAPAPRLREHRREFRMRVDDAAAIEGASTARGASACQTRGGACLRPACLSTSETATI